MTYNRNPILIKNIELLRECFKKTLKTFNFQIFAFVVLPAHFHIIIKPENINDRDEKDLHTHLDYIHYNPVKHGWSKAVKYWEYSSFQKFVKSENYDIEWGDNIDIEYIKELE